MRAALAIVVLLGCKTDDAKPSAPPAGSGAPTRDAARTAPAASAPLALPTLDDARPLMAPRATPEGDTQLASWCLDAPDAAAAAARVVATLERAGWSDVRARGTSRIAIGASHGDQRLSITIGGVDRACTGIVATATLVRAGAWSPPPPLADGERIR